MSVNTERECPTREEIVRGIVSFLTTEVINDRSVEIGEETPIISAGLIDSMGIVRLMVHLQARYGIDQFDHRDMVLHNFKSVGRIADLVAGYVSGTRG